MAENSEVENFKDESAYSAAMDALKDVNLAVGHLEDAHKDALTRAEAAEAALAAIETLTAEQHAERILDALDLAVAVPVNECVAAEESVAALLALAGSSPAAEAETRNGVCLRCGEGVLENGEHITGTREPCAASGVSDTRDTKESDEIS